MGGWGEGEEGEEEEEEEEEEEGGVRILGCISHFFMSNSIHFSEKKAFQMTYT